jgi:hypothetical protein
VTVHRDVARTCRVELDGLSTRRWRSTSNCLEFMTPSKSGGLAEGRCSACAGPPGQRVCDREVTAIVYLNEHWGSATEHGGYLRIHHPHEDGAYTDVAPHAGRLVLFQSRLVEHEVLPALRTRWAVSAWLPARAAFAA